MFTYLCYPGGCEVVYRLEGSFGGVLWEGSRSRLRLGVDCERAVRLHAVLYQLCE